MMLRCLLTASASNAYLKCGRSLGRRRFASERPHSKSKNAAYHESFRELASLLSTPPPEQRDKSAGYEASFVALQELLERTAYEAKNEAGAWPIDERHVDTSSLYISENIRSWLRAAGLLLRQQYALRFSTASSVSTEPPSTPPLSAAPLPPSFPLYAADLSLDPVVKVFTTVSAPNYLLPWQNKPQRELTGSGFVITGHRIVTNAHVVADQTFVYVRKHGSPTKFPAKVLAVGHECDLAVLTVADSTFWEDVTPLEMGDVPELQDEVCVVGYPTGGDNISVTAGVVSRVEHQQYAHGAAHLLAIQIDAAINPGSSGGPALKDKKVVGVAFQNLRGAANVGYIIPPPIINHFLEDLERFGEYRGFCALGVMCQPMDNKFIRAAMKMKTDQTGVMVNVVHPLTDAYGKLLKRDIILKFDGHIIANDGTVNFRNRERVSFDYLTSMKFTGEVCKLTILREGKELDVEVVVQPLRPLVPVHQFDKLPSYLIFAGLVFTPLTQPYLHEYGDDWFNASPRKLCDKALYGIMDVKDKQVVVLAQVLLDEVNLGYQNMVDLSVKAVNGIEVLNLAHMYEIIRTNQGEFVQFEMDEDRLIVLRMDEAETATWSIMRRHRIPIATSPDLSSNQSSPSDLNGPKKLEATGELT